MPTPVQALTEEALGPVQQLTSSLSAGAPVTPGGSDSRAHLSVSPIDQDYTRTKGCVEIPGERVPHENGFGHGLSSFLFI